AASGSAVTGSGGRAAGRSPEPSTTTEWYGPGGRPLLIGHQTGNMNPGRTLHRIRPGLPRVTGGQSRVAPTRFPQSTEATRTTSPEVGACTCWPFPMYMATWWIGE